MNPYEETKHYGHVLYGDEPEKIISLKIISKDDEKYVNF